jgi:hypothetical protein
MKVSQFKKLIKESVKEVLVEEGILSTIVAEVVRGVMSGNIIMEKQTAPKETPKVDNSHLRAERTTKQREKLQESKQKILDAIGKEAYGGVDLFEGTAPMRQGSVPGTGDTSSSPLAGVTPGDPGVDISSIVAAAGNWKEMIK